MNSEINRCSCGYDIDDKMITVKTRYSKVDYIWLSLGFSVKPKEVIFQCQMCNEIMCVSTDNELIRQYRYNSDIAR